MPGKIALVGSGEYLPEMQDLEDHAELDPQVREKRARRWTGDKIAPKIKPCARNTFAT